MKKGARITSKRAQKTTTPPHPRHVAQQPYLHGVRQLVDAFQHRGTGLKQVKRVMNNSESKKTDENNSGIASKTAPECAEAKHYVSLVGAQRLFHAVPHTFHTFHSRQCP